MSIWSAIGLSLVATCCYQIGTVMQKVGAGRVPRLELRRGQGDVLRAFLRSRIWRGGIAVMTIGWVLFLKAVANAPVSIVQPVLGFGLCLLAVFSVVFLGERLRPIEWLGTALMVGGIVLLGLSGAHETSRTASMAMFPLLAVGVAGMGVLAATVPLARAERGLPLPVVLGFAAGVLIGLAVLYTKGLFLCLEAGSPWLAWTVFLPVAMIGNIGGLWIQQAGFQRGRALIVVAMNNVTNKLVSIAGGMATLGELLPAEAPLAAARLAGFVTILVGTVILARFGEAEIAGAAPAATGLGPRPVAP